MSEADLAISVPEMPMEKPTSAFLRAGASFVPSPVTATTSFVSLKAVTRVNLSRGELLAMTLSFDFMSLNFLTFPSNWFSYPNLPSIFLSPPTASLNSLPSMQVKGSFAYSFVQIPAWIAIALAVSILSPVHIMTSIPAVLQSLIDSTTYGLRGSIIANKDRQTISFSIRSTLSYIVSNSLREMSL